MSNTSGISGVQCEVCDSVVILFSREGKVDDEDTVITVDCHKCAKTHEISIDDLVEDIAPLCCGRELLPNEYNEEANDFILSIVCAKCGAENEVSVDQGLYTLGHDQLENLLSLQ